MKKLVAAILGIFLIFSMTACSGIDMGLVDSSGSNSIDLAFLVFNTKKSKTFNIEGKTTINIIYNIEEGSVDVVYPDKDGEEVTLKLEPTKVTKDGKKFEETISLADYTATSITVSVKGNGAKGAVKITCE